MTGAQRRQQLLDIGRELFGQKGYEATSIEEIAARADVSKPVVYEHFGGKEGLYAVVVDREMQLLLDRFTSALSDARPPAGAARAGRPGAARVHRGRHRRLPGAHPRRAGDQRRGHVLVADRRGRPQGRAHPRPASSAARGYDPQLAELYSQALVGMVALVGQWWLDTRSPDKHEVAAHLVNLAYNGLAHLEPHPGLVDRPSAQPRPSGSARPARAPGTGPVHRPHGPEDARRRPARPPAGSAAVLVGGQRRHGRARSR